MTRALLGPAEPDITDETLKEKREERLAAEAWERHLRRNKSFLVKLMHPEGAHLKRGHDRIRVEVVDDDRHLLEAISGHWLYTLLEAVASVYALIGVDLYYALSPPRREKPATTTKKRVMTTRAPSARNKDSKPKDEKEVMNFFDNLLKK